MVDLLKGNGGLLAADTHLQAAAARVDREIPVAQAPHQVEGRARGLLTRQAQRVVGHRRLDRSSHLGRRTKEAVSRREAFEPLVRPLEVVVLHEQGDPSLTVVEIGEHRPRQELLPHRLPEALDLSAGLRMVRPTLHVRDTVPA